MSPWVTIIAQYGLEFALELSVLLTNKAEPTPQDFLDLKVKYGSETLDQKLAKQLALRGSVPQ